MNVNAELIDGLELPLIRRGPHRVAATTALEEWRATLLDGQYKSLPFSVFDVLPDEIIRAITHDACIRTLQHLQEKSTIASWPFLQQHGQEILDVLKKVDIEYARGRRKMNTTKPTRAPKRSRLGDENVREDRVFMGDDEDDRLIETWSCTLSLLRFL